MAAKKNEDIPPVPLPPAGSAVPPVPPVEPPPAPPAPPVAATPPPPAAVPPPPAGAAPPAPLPSTAARPDPYAAPSPPAYGQPGAYAYQPGGVAPAQGIALASLITGIAGLVLLLVGLGFLPSLAAVITGHLAQKRQPYARGFWITGLITGYIGLGLSALFGLIFFIAIIAGISSSTY